MSIAQRASRRLLAIPVALAALIIPLQAAPAAQANPSASAPHSSPAPKSSDDVKRANNCIDHWNDNHNYQNMSYGIMAYATGTLGKSWRLYCGKTHGTAADPARGLLHINTSHTVQPNTAAFTDCLYDTVGYGHPFPPSNPKYVGRRYTKGSVTADAILWNRGGYYTVITAYTRGSVSNNWTGCA